MGIRFNIYCKCTKPLIYILFCCFLLSIQILKKNKKLETFNQLNLKFREDYTTQNIKKWKIILKIFIDEPNIKMLELGTFEGRSSKFFIDNILTGSNSTLISVDFNPDITEYSKNNITQLQNFYKNFKFIKADFIKFLANEILQENRYDIIYQDGGKMSLITLYQLICCFYILKSGGILIIDDYEWGDGKTNEDGKPKLAVDIFVNLVKNDITILDIGYQFALMKN